jgi:hypothetical protein
MDVIFSHPEIGTLITQNGIDGAEWAYGMNTATFPTYGGEVVQILSVYIDNITIRGTVSTYRQMEQIYSYFTNYLQVATQGKTTGSQGGADNGYTDTGAYNLRPITFAYPARGWQFLVYPMSVPGFHLGDDVTAPTWALSAFVDDESPDLSLIQNGIKALATTQSQMVQQGTGTVDGESIAGFGLTGNISPQYGDPNTDPFQTYDAGQAQAQQTIHKYADYYNSLIPAYASGDFSAITNEMGSTPNFGLTKNQPGQTRNSTVKVPKKSHG